MIAQKKSAPRERSAKVLTVGGFETYADFCICSSWMRTLRTIGPKYSLRSSHGTLSAFKIKRFVA